MLWLGVDDSAETEAAGGGNDALGNDGEASVSDGVADTLDDDGEDGLVYGGAGDIEQSFWDELLNINLHTWYFYNCFTTTQVYLAADKGYIVCLFSKTVSLWKSAS